MAKGGDFEREICKQLSLWWTKGERDDVFWRTSGSGARATVRAKKGLNTSLSHGDITAIDPIGVPFIQRVTVEIKRGYNDSSIAAMLDKPKTAKAQPWEVFLQQAVSSAQEAGTVWWWLICKRDRKETLLYMPARMVRDFDKLGMLPRAYFFLEAKATDNTPMRVSVYACLLTDFLSIVSPEQLTSR